MAKQRDYFTLIQRGDDGAWRVEFGAYDRSDVEAELDDYRDHGAKRKDLKIVKHSDKPFQLAAILLKLNMKG